MADDTHETPPPADDAEGKTLVLRSPDHDFQTLGCADVQVNLELLCNHVVKHNGRLRVEMPGDCGGDVVILSAKELDSLEQALRIYADCHRPDPDEVDCVRKSLAALAERLEADQPAGH